MNVAVFIGSLIGTALIPVVLVSIAGKWPKLEWLAYFGFVLCLVGAYYGWQPGRPDDNAGIVAAVIVTAALLFFTLRKKKVQ